jgi:subtilase family serine protease
MSPRRSRRTALGLAAAALLGAGATGAIGASQTSNSPPPVSAGGLRGHSRPLGPTPSRASVRFSLVLRLRQGRLRRFLAGLYDPGSSSYHRFIDARAFGHRFGVSDRQLSDLRRALRDSGLRVVHVYPQRTALDLEAPAGAVDRFFGLRLMEYLAPGGRRFHSPRGVPAIPAALHGVADGVAGLHGELLSKPDDVPGNGVTPTVGAAVYDIAPLYRLGIQGQGEKVAVIETSQFQQNDLDQFSQQFQLPAFTPQQVSTPQDGGATDQSTLGEEETELDVEMIHAVAPRAQIFDYNAPDTTPAGADSLGDIIDNIVADGRVDIVSDSEGGCELGYPSADVQRDEQAIEAAVAHGITIFKSTGDAGAYECERFNRSDRRLTVEWPASSPGVVAVGGTSLSVSSTGGYAGETAWEGVLEDSGGGGGLSVLFRRPAWQRGPGVINRYSTGGREIPDVSADADPITGWTLYAGGALHELAGTSAAAPFWAGVMGLIDQYARRHGIAHLGFVDPMLYQIASTPQPAPAFHDITVGANRYYPATPGWDFATGLGSPQVYNLARDIVRYLRGHGPAG